MSMSPTSPRPPKRQRKMVDVEIPPCPALGIDSSESETEVVGHKGERNQRVKWAPNVMKAVGATQQKMNNLNLDILFKINKLIM